jgi:acetyl-CoA C-acetyltransferase
MSAVAAANPYAWFRRRRSAAEIATPTAENRFVGFPYTKYMNAIIHVDQSAAVLLTSVGAARELGIAPDRWVYPWASADATERWCVSERRDYHSAPAYRTAARRALESAGVSIDDLRYFDLYSCFPSAVQIARDMLGIAPGDPRDLTVSGGLPYHGGPGSNYAMHAIATMMTKLRGTSDGVGLVSALGWYLTTHAIGLYGATRPRRPWRRVQCHDDATDGSGAPGLAREPVGAATVETCTVMHARDGAPVHGLVIGRLEDGRRFLANTAEDRGVLEALMSDDSVGRRGRVEPIDGKNRFEPL